MPDLLIGLDLGKRSDPTALSVVYRSLRVGANGRTERDAKGLPLYRFRCPRLKQYPLGTDYTEIIEDVRALLSEDETPDPAYLVIDATGVGAAVVEMFRNAHLPKAILIPVTITAGLSCRRDRFARGLSGWWVAKAQLASQLQAVMQGGHLKVDRGISYATILKKELQNFQVKITTAAHETFSAREGEHDDLVLSLAMPVWVGSQPRTHYLNNAQAAVSAKEAELLEAETATEDAARAAEAEAEQKRKDQEWHDPGNPYWWDQGGGATGW